MSYAPSNFRTAAAPAGRPRLRSMREEARDAILQEQVSYLIDHGCDCPADCPACARLLRVQEVLLEPFQSAFYPPARRV